MGGLARHRVVADTDRGVIRLARSSSLEGVRSETRCKSLIKRNKANVSCTNLDSDGVSSSNNSFILLLVGEPDLGTVECLIIGHAFRGSRELIGDSEARRMDYATRASAFLTDVLTNREEEGGAPCVLDE